MIAIDSNILVYAHRSDSQWHEVASRTLRRLYEGSRRWCIPFTCAHEFFSVVTRLGHYQPPTPRELALQHLAFLAASPSVRFIGETADHLTVLADLIRESGIAGPRVYDARIAAVCIEHGVEELWTADRDFRQFPSLTTRNPLVES